MVNRQMRFRRVDGDYGAKGIPSAKEEKLESKRNKAAYESWTITLKRKTFKPSEWEWEFSLVFNPHPSRLSFENRTVYLVIINLSLVTWFAKRGNSCVLIFSDKIFLTGRPLLKSFYVIDLLDGDVGSSRRRKVGSARIYLRNLKKPRAETHSIHIP